jgi:hypothetical protein
MVRPATSSGNIGKKIGRYQFSLLGNTANLRLRYVQAPSKAYPPFRMIILQAHGRRLPSVLMSDHDERALNEARCSNELLEHLEHLEETNDLFGNVAKSLGQCPRHAGDAVRPTPYRLNPVPGYPLSDLSKINLKSASVYQPCFGQQPIFMEPLPFPLSSRAKPRGLQFRGPLLETRNTLLKQNCHLACPGVPWDRSVAKWRDLRFSLPIRGPEHSRRLQHG